MALDIKPNINNLIVTYEAFKQIKLFMVAKLNKEIYLHCKDFEDSKGFFTDSYIENFKNETERIKQLCLNKDELNLVNFALTTDVRGEITPDVCSSLLTYISDFDKNEIIGFYGNDMQDAHINSFVEVLNYCIQNKVNFSWR